MATMMPVAVLIGYFQQMLREHWAYAWDGAEEGKVGCAGAFVWALKQYGISLYNGSNRLARVAVDTLIPIGVANIVPGMAAFKHRKKGDSGYDLKACYEPGGAYYNGDLNDYYHIGLVDEDTSRVLNAQGTTTGFVASDIRKGGWSHVAYLKQVDYGAKADQPVVDESTQGKEVNFMVTLEIYAANGKAVNLRSAPSTSATRIKQLKVGTQVELIGYVDATWAQVSASGSKGYVMREFLRGDNASANADSDSLPSNIEERLAILERRVSALEDGHG